MANNGNAPIERLAFVFWSGHLCLKIEPKSPGAMKWLMLAQAFSGIVQFMEEFEWMAVKIVVLDDEAGPVARGTMVYAYGPGGVGSNGSSLVGTS